MLNRKYRHPDLLIGEVSSLPYSTVDLSHVMFGAIIEIALGSYTFLPSYALHNVNSCKEKVNRNAIMSLLAVVFLLPIRSLAAPVDLAIQPRAIQSIGFVDPSSDEWSSTLSGIGPLILLLGERTTKQVLRSVRGFSTAFSLAAAPLGLLSVATSLIRFCGTQKLRAFIGYELEARPVVGIEVTRVNCGGVSAHLTDGYVVRSVAANPVSQLNAVSILEGKEKGLESEALARIKASKRFESEKRRLGIPAGEANVNWCLHITAPDFTEVKDSIIQTLVRAVGLESNSKGVVEFEQNFMAGRPEGEKSIDHSAEPEISGIATDRTRPSFSSSIGKLRLAPTSSTLKSPGTSISVVEVAPTLSNTIEKRSSGSPFWNFTFMTTFDAVSEFTTCAPSPEFSSAAIGIVSSISIITVYLLALRNNDWIMSIGWILMIVGYIGIVFGVMAAALLMNSSCISIKLDARLSRNSSAKWKDGMVVSVKNVDSMDTTGSAFVSSQSPHHILEAVYIKSSTRNDRSLASFVTISLILSFLAHYLGLRAVKWWVSVGELGICILAAFARSVSNDLRPRFSEVKGVKIDKRCSSTGVIDMQTARLVDGSIPPTNSMDARSYSLRSLDNTPMVGERVAYQTAKLVQQDPSLCSLFKTLTGMHLAILPSPSPESTSTRSILVSFTGGILVSEGLASPASRLLLSFESSISDLAAPSSLLGRAIMRQPEWRLLEGAGKGIPLGNVYLFAMQNMLDWWTLSEDRNDMGDLQRNLQWPMFLVNIAFFVRCFIIGKEDKELSDELDAAHNEVGVEDVKVARDVIRFLRKWEL